MKKLIILLFLVLFSGISFAFATSEIVYPRVEIINKTTVNSINVTEILPTIPKQKISEITLKSTDYTIFKQRQAGDYILITIVNFDGKNFIYDFVKLMITFHSENSADFAVYDLDNKLILSGINIAKDRSKQLDVTLDGKDDLVLSYLGYDVSKLASFKVKAYLPEDKLYYKGNYCELISDKTKYKCYIEDSQTGSVKETYELNASDLKLSGTTAEDAVKNLVKKTAIDKKNELSKKQADKNISQIGDQKGTFDWWKILLIVIIIFIVILLFFKGKNIKKKNNDDDDYSIGEEY